MLIKFLEIYGAIRAMLELGSDIEESIAKTNEARNFVILILLAYNLKTRMVILWILWMLMQN